MKFDYKKIKNEINNIRLTNHFKLSEFLNPIYDYDDVYIDDDLLKKLEKLRNIINKPIYITKNGGFRCEKQNINCDGAKSSFHLLGKAIDIQVKDLKPIEVGLYGAICGFNGIIIYDNFTHLDVRENIYIK